MSRRVLITGGAGQLGSDLTEALAGDEVEAPGHEQLDVCDQAAIDRAFNALKPELVVNCAAFHNLGECESDPATAFEVNAIAVGRLAERCAQAEAKLVHLSTNYAFDGRRPEPYGERDLPSPESAYAISKVAGEQFALAADPGALVVRTSGLFGLRGNASKGGNFVERILARAGAGEAIAMVSDQRLTPTYTSDLAAGLLQALDLGLSGLLHLTSAGECSWLEFTKEILEIAGVEAPVEAVETTVRPGEPRRPLNGVLEIELARSAGVTMRPWTDALRDYMRRAGFAAVPQPS